MEVRKRIAAFAVAACFALAGILAWTDNAYAGKISNAAQAEQKALKKVKDATVVDVERDYEDGVLVYEVELVKGTKKYEIMYRASDGKMVSYGWEKRNVGASASKPLISKSKCRSLATKQVEGGEILSLTYKVDDGIAVYKVKIAAGNKKYTLKYHARTGALIDYEWDLKSSSSANNGYIGLEQAQEIALAKIPGATAVNAEFDNDDGIAVYEIELVKGQYEYEFKIDAKTGKILEQEKDWRD